MKQKTGNRERAAQDRRCEQPREPNAPNDLGIHAARIDAHKQDLKNPERRNADASGIYIEHNRCRDGAEQRGKYNLISNDSLCVHEDSSDFAAAPDRDGEGCPTVTVKGAAAGKGISRQAGDQCSLMRLSVVSTVGSLSTVCMSSMIPAIAAVDCVKLGAVI